MKLLTIIGARPQFIKASVVSKEIEKTKGISEIILHTGQHFDENMSEIFFSELSIPRPDIQLNIHGGNHGEMTGRMMIEIEKVLLEYKPDCVLVYGDTNSTLAGALVASKLHIRVAHVEAGLRSFNMLMPEEVNRIVTDQVSDMLFCPTEAAMLNLSKEGLDKKGLKIFKVGDVMQDSALFFAQRATFPKSVDKESGYILATLHRAENTDDPLRLKAIIDAMNTLHEKHFPVVLPVHPRTRKIIDDLGLKLKCKLIEPVGYLDMIGLLQNSSLVLTDSGGVQKEAFFFGKPCVTMRDQTEWVELVDIGANKLVGADTGKIIKAVIDSYGSTIKDEHNLYGGGFASHSIVQALLA